MYKYFVFFYNHPRLFRIRNDNGKYLTKNTAGLHYLTWLNTDGEFVYFLKCIKLEDHVSSFSQRKFLFYTIYLCMFL